MKKKFLIPIIAILLILLTGFSASCKATKTVPIGTPTIFFHGYKSSYHAESHMVIAAEQAGVTNSVILANVDRKGKVKLIGKLRPYAKNPIVEVNFENNRSLNYNKRGQWATNVVKALRKKYSFKKMNMVAHSMGNISIIYYLLQNYKNKKMPKLVKQVDIAGHYAGLNFKHIPKSISEPKNLKINKAGKPTPMNASYKYMTKLRKVMPNKQIRVLNIMGNIGHGTDGTVSNKSTLSLKYLVAKRAKSYKLIKLKGKMAQHSKLHSNYKVDRALIKFLWNK